MQNLIFGISLWWLAPVSILAIVLTFWLYRNDSRISHLSKGFKFFLGSLRFLAFLLIGVLILGLIFETTKNQQDKPLIVFNVDDSKSMLNYSDSSEVKKLNIRIADLKKKLGDKFDFVSFPSDLDSFEFAVNQTNLASRYDEISKNYGGRNVGAVVSISDGNYNEGMDPVYSAEKLGYIPVYTVGVGDSIRKKDLYVQDVYANKMAFLGNKFPVEILLGHENAKSEKSKLTLFMDDKVVYNSEINFDSTDLQQITVQLEANKIGVRKIRAVLDPVLNEFTTANNTFEIYARVIDSRTNLTFVSSGITPDAGVLKQVFRKDSRINFENVLLDDFAFKKKKNQVLILHNLGSSSKARQLRSWILSNNINSIQILGVSEDASEVNRLNSDIKIAQLTGEESFLPKVNDQFKDFTISSEVKSLLSDAPPLMGRNYKVGSYDKSKTIAYQRVGTLTKDAPSIYLSKTNNTTNIIFFGEGLWRWRLFDYQKNKSPQAFDELITKMISYLTKKESNKRLQVEVPSNCNSNSNTIIKAEFYNEAYELITTPEIGFELLNESGVKQDLGFSVFENHYELNLGRLTGGKYSWTAQTIFNGKSFKEEGEFVVESKDLERLNTRSDFGILNSISENTGGQFFTYSNWDDLEVVLKSDPNVKPVNYQEKEFKDLLDYIWWLIIIISLLSVEWFIRKYSGTY